VKDIRPIDQFATQWRQFDLAIYQMGNSEFHAAIYDQLRQFPGLTVLHEAGLHHFMAWRTAWRGDFAGYAREMGYALGVGGVQQAREIRMGQRDYALFEYSLNERVLDLSLGVLVHSEFVAQQIRRKRRDQMVKVVSQPIAVTEPATNVRPQLGLPVDVFVVGCAGQVTLEKRIDVALRAFAQLRVHVPDARFLLVGQVPDWYPLDLDELIRQLDLQVAVVRIGYAPDLDQFRAYIGAMDVCVNLRYPTVGETSASLLRIMALGRATIVSDAGWYAELPDECCLKIDYGPDVETILAKHLIDLADDRERCEMIGRNARAYIERECDPDRVARVYVDAVQQVLERVKLAH